MNKLKHIRHFLTIQAYTAKVYITNVQIQDVKSSHSWLSPLSFFLSLFFIRQSEVSATSRKTFFLRLSYSYAKVLQLFQIWGTGKISIYNHFLNCRCRPRNSELIRKIPLGRNLWAFVWVWCAFVCVFTCNLCALVVSHIKYLAMYGNIGIERGLRSTFPGKVKPHWHGMYRNPLAPNIFLSPC